MKKSTIATQFGYDSKEGYGSVNIPIHQTTAYDFGSAEEAANRFSLKSLGQIYTRLTNPTTDIFEAKMAALEEGEAAIGVSSGQAATFFAVANLASNGENIIISNKIYGGSVSLFKHTMKRFGIEARVFDSDTADDLESLIDNKTKAIFFESLSNPQIAIPNLEKIAQVAKKYKIITIVDNTVATPILFNPFEHGFDVVIHSASKYINGQGSAIAGVIIERKGLNEYIKSNPRYAHFNEPDDSYHGLVYSELPPSFPIFTLRIRLALLRDIGATLAPFNSWILLQGLETLDLRIKQHSNSALKIASWLEKHPKVKSVNYPGLKSCNTYERAQKYLENGLASGLLSFDVGDFEFAKKILNSTKLFKVVVNIGDSKSIITHPASTTHSQLSEEELKSAGISQGLIRLSIGLEDVDDLINDLSEALK
ncbi:O-acetylhomoserine aminocarboxypropyltransferase/cysteine synthase family protein [Campylobacter sputorum]|uniref:O-acetylhomoserine aminocarboxypropyltransferase/cysteine synthase family protein n=1 Tax=Campylobacter sputorum TaxID=206 RepID=UPI00053BEF5B|nr:aminotransferase class I/II-fold pyridoxal phosphate-dependent enzyme [Campylobacter sputorum]